MKKFYIYAMIFLLLLLSAFAFGNQAQADELIDFHYNMTESALHDTPQSKMVAIVLAALSHYGIDCIKEWHYINNKLYWSQYHYEMLEFYEEVLRNG